MEEKATNDVEKKFCKHCGAQINTDAVICTQCGRQVEEMHYTASPTASTPNIIINNTNTNTNGVFPGARQRSKWVALLLCIFLGFLGVHKFYENKIGLGILYLCTLGICGIGVLIDFVSLLFKPNPYYV